MPLPADQPALIQAIAQRQDQAAFAKLFDYFAPRVKALMIRSEVDAFTADEIAQETMATVWRDAAAFDPKRTTLAGWIFSIARDLRAEMVRGERSVTAVRADAAANLPDQVLVLAEHQARLKQALAKLPIEQATVVRKAFLEEKSHSEIERELQLPLGTVKSRLRLAIRRLRAQLEDLR